MTTSETMLLRLVGGPGCSGGLRRRSGSGSGSWAGALADGSGLATLMTISVRRPSAAAQGLARTGVSVPAPPQVDGVVDLVSLVLGQHPVGDVGRQLDPDHGLERRPGGHRPAQVDRLAGET